MLLNRVDSSAAITAGTQNSSESPAADLAASSNNNNNAHTNSSPAPIPSRKGDASDRANGSTATLQMPKLINLASSVRLVMVWMIRHSFI